MWPLRRADPIFPHIDLKRHRHLRDILRRHQMAATKGISRKAMQRCAEQLGILGSSRNELLLDSEGELVILMDFALYDDRQRGRTPMGKYLAQLPAVDDPDELVVRHAMASPQFAVIEATRIERGVGIESHDLLRGETIRIVDEMFSISVCKGWYLAGHLLPFPDYWVTSGAAFPLASSTATAIRALAESQPHAARTPQAEAELARMITATAFADGTTSQVAYL